jgi:hypothetical protein
MSRPVRYRDADTLLENCSIRGHCFVWPNTSNNLAPILTANSPLAKQFATTSVARILFTIIKFPPASKRITRWCTTEFCVNPWHHRESKPFVEKRRRQVLPYDDLPEQDSHRHLIAPDEATLTAMKPKNPIFTDLLARSAGEAGIDCMGLKSRRFLGMSVRHTGAEVSSTDKDTKPVLVMKSLVEKQKREAEAQANPYTPEKADEDWDEIEKLFSHIGKSKTANTAP